MKKILIVFFVCFNISFSQLKNDELFKVNDSIVSIDEFNRVYNKNIDLIDEDNQKDFETYLDLFVNYKVKLARFCFHWKYRGGNSAKGKLMLKLKESMSIQTLLILTEIQLIPQVGYKDYGYMKMGVMDMNLDQTTYYMYKSS